MPVFLPLRIYMYDCQTVLSFSFFFALVKDDNQKKEGRIETTYRAMTLNGRKLFVYSFLAVSATTHRKEKE